MPIWNSFREWKFHNLMVYRILIYRTLNMKDWESRGMKFGDRVGHYSYPPENLHLG